MKNFKIRRDAIQEMLQIGTIKGSTSILKFINLLSVSTTVKKRIIIDLKCVNLFEKNFKTLTTGKCFRIIWREMEDICLNLI